MEPAVEAVLPTRILQAEFSHSKASLKRAGKILASSTASEADRKEARATLNDWRAIHASPLNTMHKALAERAQEIDPKALVAQRLKRTKSIIQKLERNPGMMLHRMQDIGGCRAVVKDVRAVNRLVKSIKNSKAKHVLVNEKNYIENPKYSGYRCHHLVFRYRSNRRKEYNDLQIEIQIRSKRQHYWATAVETVSTFLDRSLKSSEGPAEWLKFFSLASSAFAYLERTPPHPDAPPRDQLIATLQEMFERLRVEETLTQYRKTLRTMKRKKLQGARYLLISLAPKDGRQGLEIRSYKAGQIKQATRDYLLAEEELSDIPNAQAVLLSVQHLESLKKAFPNYFLDTHLFLRTLKQAIQIHTSANVREIEVEPYQSDISFSALIEQTVEIDLDNTAGTIAQIPNSIADTAMVSQAALEEAPFSVERRSQWNGV